MTNKNSLRATGRPHMYQVDSKSKNRSPQPVKIGKKLIQSTITVTPLTVDVVRNVNGSYVSGWKIRQFYDDMIKVYSVGNIATQVVKIFDLGKLDLKFRSIFDRQFTSSKIILFQEKEVMCNFILKLNKKSYYLSPELNSSAKQLPFEFSRSGKIIKKNMDLYKKSLNDDNDFSSYAVFVDDPHILDNIMLQRAQFLVLIDTFDDLMFEESDYFVPMRKLCNATDFVAFAKYLTAYPLAKYLKNDLPRKPIGYPEGHPLLFEGKILHLLKARLCKQSSSKNNEKSLSLWMGYLQGVKRACNSVDDEYIIKAYVTHADLLKVYRDYDELYYTRFVENCKIFSNKFTCTELKIYSPSTSAHYDSSYKEGGALGLLKRLVSDLNENTPEDLEEANKMFLLDPYSGQLSVLTGIPKVDFKEAAMLLLNNKYGEGFFKPSLITSLPDYIVSPNSWEPMLKVMAYAISEPLKVRMITKGEVLPYFIAKHFQRETWSYLKTFPQFDLTNEVLEIKHLEQVIAQERTLEKRFKIDLGFDSWVSGDYKAATDNIKSAYTTAAFETLLKHVSDWRETLSGPSIIEDETYKNILRSVLYNSTISYPKDTGLDDVRQRNGQMMGSPLSFPVLCMINLLAYYEAMKEYLIFCNPNLDVANLNIRSMPVKVNGDDILFRTNPKFYSFWLKSIREVGFELSLGKNYVHPSVLTINSQCFLYKSNDITQEVSFSKIGYLNAGILTGQSKLSIRRSGDLLPLCDWYNLVLDGANNKHQAHKDFLFYHKERVAIASNNGDYNLFVDTHLGGCGFKNLAGIEVKYTSFQRRFANFMRTNFGSYMTPKSYKSRIFRPLIETDKKSDSLDLVMQKPELIYLLPIPSNPCEEELEIIKSTSVKSLLLDLTETVPLWEPYSGGEEEVGRLNKIADQEKSMLSYKSGKHILKAFRNRLDNVGIYKLTDQEMEQRYSLQYLRYDGNQDGITNYSDLTSLYTQAKILNLNDSFWERPIQVPLEGRAVASFANYTRLYHHIKTLNKVSTLDILSFKTYIYLRNAFPTEHDLKHIIGFISLYLVGLSPELIN